MIKVKEDLTGMRFGKLTVLKREDDHITPKGKHIPMWLCQCDCGSPPKKIMGQALRRGTTKSCGCLQKEIAAKQCRELFSGTNKYDLSLDYGIGYTNTGEVFYFDLEDYDIIKNYSWYKNDSGYILARVDDKNIRMHRLILDAPDDCCVDHIHGKETRNDNRKANLRIATNSQNHMNIGNRKNSSSGFRGVRWKKHAKKWMVSICCNGKNIFLGYYGDFDNAVEARLKAEEKYFGEFSYDYSQKM